MRFIIIFSFLSIVHLSCDTGLPVFDGQRSYKHLVDQCEFGPRHPGSKGHLATKKYITEIVKDLLILYFYRNSRTMFTEKRDVIMVRI